MTTPSINRNEVLTIPAKRKIYNVVNGVKTLASEVILPTHVEWDQQVRPESSTVPFGNDRFRPCKPWTHSGGLVSRSRGTLTYTNKLSSTLTQITEYEDGSCWLYGPASTPAFPSSLEKAAEYKALERLRNQNIHLGVFLAESRKTVSMIGDLASRIARQVRTYRKFNPRKWNDVVRSQNGQKTRSLWKNIPSDWLQLQYGWNPLLSDINGALAELYDKITRGQLFRVTGRASRTDHADRNVNSRINSNTQARCRQTTTHVANVSLWYSLINPGLAEYSSLGLVNPAEIVWECIPYSFVVDWFLPIGPYLSSITADAGYSFKSGSCSRMSRSREEITSVRFARTNIEWSSGSPIVVGGPGRFNFRRTCYGGSPVPGVYLKNPLSLTRVLNSLALLSRAFHR